MVEARPKLAELRSLWPYLLSGAALLGFIVYICSNVDRYRTLLDLSVGSVLSMSGLALILLGANGLTNYLLYGGLGVEITLREGFGLAAVNALASYLPLPGGLVAKGMYLRQRHDLSYLRFLSATAALYVCFVAANGVLGIGMLGFLRVARGTIVPVAVLVGFIAMVGSALLLWLPVDGALVPRSWRKRLHGIAEGWQTLSRDWPLIGKLIGLRMVMSLILAGRFWLAFRALSQDVSLSHCLLFSSATVLTRLVSIAPGGLGVREAIVAGVASSIGFDAGVGAVSVGLDRLIETSVIVLLGVVYTYVLGTQIRQGRRGDTAGYGE